MSLGCEEVVVTYPGFDPEDGGTAGVLREAGFAIRHEPRVSDRKPVEVIRIMAGATAGIVSTDPFDAKVFASCPRLRVLARVGVGVDTIDLEAASRAGVAVTITPGVNAATAADHTLALVLACCRRLLENDSMLRRGSWDRGGSLNGNDLTGATVGIVGLGSIGQAVARRLTGFDVRLLGTDVARTDADGIEIVSLEELLEACDIVTLHVPLQESTRGLMGHRELGRMRRGSILINTARGGLVDEEALVACLRDGHIASAGLDVFEHEPPIGSPLLELTNVVLTPHIGGLSVEAQRAMLEMAVGSIIDLLAGRRPPGLLNPEALASSQPSSISAMS